MSTSDRAEDHLPFKDLIQIANFCAIFDCSVSGVSLSWRALPIVVQPRPKPWRRMGWTSAGSNSMSSAASVAAAAAVVRAAQSRLDVLVNNAGIAIW